MNEDEYKIFVLALMSICTSLIAVYGIMKIAYAY
jgi:hypothetical protein